MLRPNKVGEIPAMTRLVAEAAFLQRSLCMVLRDELGPVFADEGFAPLYSELGQPSESSAQLALVTVLQYVENLTDRQAADAVRSRIDWKYALGLELTDAGFHYSVLSEFRQRLLAGGQESLLLDKLLECCVDKELLGGKQKQRTDSTHVVAAVRSLTLLELVGETMRRLLNDLAQVAPQWLKEQVQPQWVERYGRSFDLYRLPKGKEERIVLAETIGHDGFALLGAILLEDAPATARELPLMETMRCIWLQQFYCCDDQVHWRTKQQWGQPPAHRMIASPDDLEAKYCVKRSTEWIGYKVHLTETCAADQPHLITQVTTTPATTHDVKAMPAIQDDLAAKNLLPEVQLVDQGYLETDLLVSCQERGIDLVGPMPSSKSWQDRQESAFDHTMFTIDWEQRVATCPASKTSRCCSDRQTWRGTPNLVFAFSPADCLPCPSRANCSQASGVGRTLTIYPEVQYTATRRHSRCHQRRAHCRLAHWPNTNGDAPFAFPDAHGTSMTSPTKSRNFCKLR